MYSGDELYDEEVTSGPYDPERDDFDAERQDIEDEYDREQSR
jgi:hypothetical protein